MIWVVGGTSGIGAACMKMLTHEGLPVIATGKHAVNVKSQKDIEGFPKRKEIDKIVYSAGINHLDWYTRVSLSKMMDLYEVNVVGLLRILQATPQVRRVVVIGSDAAWRPMRTSVAYCASKAALHMAVQVIAKENQDLMITAVAPGKVENTDMTKYVDERSAELRPDMNHIRHQLSQIPSGRFLHKMEVATVVRWLLLDAPTSMSGSIVPVNGGRS